MMTEQEQFAQDLTLSIRLEEALEEIRQLRAAVKIFERLYEVEKLKVKTLCAT